MELAVRYFSTTGEPTKLYIHFLSGLAKQKVTNSVAYHLNGPNPEQKKLFESMNSGLMEKSLFPRGLRG